MQPPMMPHISSSDRPEFVRAPASGPPGVPDVVSVGVVGGGVAKDRRNSGNKYLLPTEFEFCAVSYGTSVYPLIYTLMSRNASIPEFGYFI